VPIPEGLQIEPEVVSRTFRMEEPIYARLRKQAKRHGISINGMAIVALVRWLETVEREEKKIDDSSR
jgi:hypothetical protein